jgi:predicted transcriptional regulator YdeE
VELNGIKVMYVIAEGGISGVKEAWERLESKVGSLKGRKFYGAYFHDKEEYRACIAIRENDDPAASGLKVWTIPGGKYARSKMDNWPANIDRIAPAFDEMATAHDHDDSRPSIEFYRSQRELILLLPVK